MSRRVVAFAGGALFLLPLLSLGHAPQTTVSSLALLGVLGGLTLIRPVWGLAAMAGLYPLAVPLGALLTVPIDERMVLTFLAAASLRMSFGERLPATQLGRPLLFLGVLFAASELLSLSFQQQRTEPLGPFALHLWQHVTSGYFTPTDAFSPLHDLAQWMEAFALAVIAEQILRQRPARGASIVRLLLIGGCAVAVFASVRLAEIGLRSELPLSAVARVFGHVRFNTLYTDVNAAGSLFALFLVAAVWMAWRGRHVWAAVGALFLAVATWAAGSRAAFGGAIGGLLLIWLIARRPSKRLVLAAGGLAIVALLALTFTSVRNLSTDRAAYFRVEMAATALRLTATAPVFGVGVNRFRLLSTSVFSERMLTSSWARTGENAHNNFLQVLAELGVFGLAAFVWSLTPLFRNVWRHAMARTETVEMMALAGGIGAFLLSAMLGHPLLVAHVRGVFFLALGVTTAISAPDALSSSRWRRVVFLLALVTVLVCVPFRVADQRRSNALHGVFYGASDQHEPLDGVSYRVAEATSVWFVSSSAAAVEIPLRTTADSAMPCRVDLWVDGRAANVATPIPDLWTPLSFQLPAAPAGVQSRRIELHVTTGNCTLMVGDPSERH